MLGIQVWDTGRGIAPGEQRLVFEEFRRGDSAFGQGLGLGLSIAERMARLLEHPLRLQSWPGRGTVFAVRVPRATTRKPSLGTIPPAPMPATAAGTIIIVDNHLISTSPIESLVYRR